ncbi:hypothetical protein MIND_00842400 [Mycena indigotica]|uniref:Uncharacterized protein n=1 Tax=Mycena indigotica TaxID=2126181 RepID=A0A8H6SHA2_9AGAR|nr:uncharacterized protein MIND_00842400 [Mycena indigotica]KAF7298943.1 hypothetical protein MIND_00842400 [Mycena indigotica]
MSPSTTTPLAAPVAASTPVVADKDARSVVTVSAAPSVKDQRAYEHDRQRVKKAADLVKMRALKGQRGWAALAKGDTYTSSRKNAFQPGSEKTKLLRPEEVDLLEDEPVYHAAKVASFGGITPDPTQPIQLKLGDLMTTFRKPRKATASDFVVIPPRSVIPLDDMMPRDLIVEEPWEHIYGVDDESGANTTTKAPSYAQVLMNIK